MSIVRFTVQGTPIPKGSTRAFVVKGRAITTSANDKTRPWEASVKASAAEAMDLADKYSTRGAVSISIVYCFHRKLGDWGKGRNSARLKESAPKHHTVKPDIDKLDRAILDALTGVCYLDDSQVSTIRSTKEWCEGTYSPHAIIEVEFIE